MINETLNATASLKDVATGDLFWATIGSALIALVPITMLFFSPKLIRIYHIFRVRMMLRKFTMITGRDVVVMAHMESGLFGSMITTSDAVKLEKIMRILKGRDFDLILHTPGGELFSAIRIANLLYEYPGKVRVIVPKFAMSGGTLLSLAADSIHMKNTSYLGPIDPQLGTLFKFYSARAWKEIIKFKGKKSEDQSLAMKILGEQATKTIEDTIKKFIGKNKKLSRLLLSGDIEHSRPFNKEELKKAGLKKLYSMEVFKDSLLPDMIIENFPSNPTIVYCLRPKEMR